MKKNRPPSENTARALALTLVDGCLRRGESLAGKGAASSSIAPSDAARGKTLASDILRYHRRNQATIQPFVKRIPPNRAKDILHLGTVELCKDGLPAYGVVNSAVSLAKKHPQSARYSGLINAVLRQIAREGAVHWKNASPQSLPEWIAGPLRKTYGKRVVHAIEKAHEQGARLDITPKDETALASLLKAYSDQDCQILPNGTLRLRTGQKVTAMPGYCDGGWWVQDAGAALATKVLNPKPGEKILDLCAAPGGKTLQLAAQGADVTSIDISEKRLERLRENLTRCRLSANLICEDALNHSGQYSAVLLDAPCTSSGTFRRHPELNFLPRADALKDLVQTQSALLDHALTLLEANGRLIYCTCSLLPQEGHLQAKKFLARHENTVTIETINAEGLNLPANWISAEGALITRPDFWPEFGGIDGFYIAMFRYQPQKNAPPLTKNLKPKR